MDRTRAAWALLKLNWRQYWAQRFLGWAMACDGEDVMKTVYGGIRQAEKQADMPPGTWAARMGIDK